MLKSTAYQEEPKRTKVTVVTMPGLTGGQLLSLAKDKQLLRLSLYYPDFFYTSHNTLHTTASSKHNGVDDYDDDDVDVGFS